MKKNRNGFTLIELLVTISILGIIIVLALPAVHRLQQQNKNTKYQYYQKSMLSGAKLYVDSYSKDMFGNNNSGCYEISYDELKTSNLLKDIQINDVNCDTDKTFIRVYKSNDYNRYTSSIVCKNKTGRVVYQDLKGESEVCSNTPDKEGPTITITPNGTSGYVQSTKARVTISDTYGLLENNIIEYAWASSPTARLSDSDYKEISFKNKRYENSVSIELNTPAGVSGNYYLIINPKQVRDSLGNYQSEKKVSEAFKLDNQAPSFNSSTLGSSTNFQSLTSKFSLAATDNITATPNLKMYISNSGYQTSGSWETYNASKIWKLSGSYDGGTRKVYVSLKDLAGNISNKTFTYTVYQQCSKTTTSYSEYSSCSVSCGSGKKTRTKYVEDEYMGATCSGNNIKEIATCDTGIDCCSKTNNSGSWYNSGNCSKSCGGGQQKQLMNTVSAYDGSACPATEKYISCNTQSCCTGPTTTYTAWSSCSGSCGTGKQTRKKIVTQCNGTKTETTETQNCNTGVACCSKTKNSGSWTNDGSCSKKCGTGKQKQKINKISAYDGSSCGTESRTVDCNTQTCCSKTKTSGGWYNSGSCSTSCGTGKQKQLRKKISAYDGSACGTESQTISCKTACSINCTANCTVKKDCRQGTYIHRTPDVSNGSVITSFTGKFYVVSTTGSFYYGVTSGGTAGYVYSSCLNDTGEWCPNVSCKG